ncbi:MAG: tetratricopeptide repeat protein, partial [Deltaproteobacteria bacterium]|nr:tetratricopeptide repeat protein [Deltaproteobacteria bacterium]
FQIASTYYLEGDTKEALKGFEGVIKEYPDSPIYYEALFAKARVYDEEGRLAEALEILRGLDGKYPNREALKTAVEWTEKRLNTDPGHNRR